MKPEFYTANRKALAAKMEPGSIGLIFSGHAPLKTSDEFYPFFAHRNFVYLTGIEEASLVLLIEKEMSGHKEILFILPPDRLIERGSGIRIKSDQAAAKSGIQDVRYVGDFKNYLRKLATSGRFDKLCLDLAKYTPEEPDDEAFQMAATARTQFPWLSIRNLRTALRQLRLIKQPCEIEALRKAEEITREGIINMMKASKPGMYEYQYKAIWDFTLLNQGVLNPGFPPIISGGSNNFCIHYYGYTGQVNDGDMVLNDVGAIWNHMINDVSRGWPCNGKFSDRQKLLYQCAYNSAEYAFSMIRPGMPMNEVDQMIRKYNFEQLKMAGVCKDYSEVGTYMWHGGAHHVGFDVHDQVTTNDEPTLPIAPNMVFCVDVGIYHEEWGIGFRLEDNCLVTEDGCENLSVNIPRTIEEIEGIMS